MQYGTPDALQLSDVESRLELNMKRWIVLWFAILMPAIVVANDAKLAPELQQAATDQMVSVIVQYKAAPTAVNKNNIVVNGGAVSGDLPLVRGVTATVPLSKLAGLSERRFRGLHFSKPRGAKPPEQCGARSAGELCLGLGS